MTPSTDVQAVMWRPRVIVVPCYNEEERLDAETFARFASNDPETGFLFVDDGSTDGTGALLRAAEADGCDGVRVKHLNHNRGKAEAVRSGLSQGIAWGARTVGYWDADLACPLGELQAMIALLETSGGLHGVLASRVRLLGRAIERQPARHYLGRAFATAASAILRLPVYDTQCGAKLFRVSDTLERALEEPFRSRWIFDVELLARLRSRWGAEAALRLEEYPVRRWKDIGGSKLRLRAFPMAALALARIWMEDRRHRS